MREMAHQPTMEADAGAEVAFADHAALPATSAQSDVDSATTSGEDAESPAPPVGASQSARPVIVAHDERATENAEEASLQIPRGVMPAPLRGSLENLERQNARVDAEGLERIQDEADLAERIAHKLLVPIPVSAGLSVNPELPQNHRYCRPWTANFLADLARSHDTVFHKPLEVSSAVRTVEYQERLMRINGNAAPAEGDVVSPHLTGATVDIAKSGLSRSEIAWMRQRLLELETAGKIDVEEEFKQACFHITVYRSYVPAETAHPASQEKAGAPKNRHPKADVTPEPVAAAGI